MSINDDYYLHSLMDERSRVQNLANTYNSQLASNANLSDHQRLEIYAVLGKLNSEIGQYDIQIAKFRTNRFASW